MRGFPPELIYVLIFIGALLVQYLVKRRASREPPEPEQDEPAAPAPHEISADSAGLQQAASTAGLPQRLSVDQRDPASAAPPARARRRFARQLLMGTRRDAQNALVIATILGPCRALEPLRNEQPARGLHQGRVVDHSAEAA
jgi:hypothetical protein